jgi:hypothetical protein
MNIILSILQKHAQLAHEMRILLMKKVCFTCIKNVFLKISCVLLMQDIRNALPFLGLDREWLYLTVDI